MKKKSILALSNTTEQNREGSLHQLKTYKEKELRINHIRHITTKLPFFIVQLLRCIKLTNSILIGWFMCLKGTLFPSIRYRGYCPCCNKKTLFVATDCWLRDSLRCVKCNSLPRDRQVFKYINTILKQRTDLNVLEFAAVPGAYMHDRKTKSYIISHYYPTEKFGKLDTSFYNEDIQQTTFQDNTFDLVIHEDVLEHINAPFQAVLDSFRILADNGILVFTCPISYDGTPTKQLVSVDNSGSLILHQPATYHGNPISENGSLVFWEFGYDFEQNLRAALPKNAELEHIIATDDSMGISGAMLDLFCIKKLPA